MSHELIDIYILKQNIHGGIQVKHTCVFIVKFNLPRIFITWNIYNKILKNEEYIGWAS